MNNTVKYFLKTLLRLVIYLCVILVMFFILAHSRPGNPYLMQLGEHMTQTKKAWYLQQVTLLGLDKPIISQFFIYVGNLFSGNLGTSVSIAYGTPVLDLINTKLPKIFELLLITLFISGPLGFLIGHFSGKYKNSVFDYIFRGLCYLGIIIIPVSMVLGLKYMFRNSFLPLTNYFDVGVGDIGTPYATVKAITGLPLLDFLLHGRLDLWWSTLKHLLLPLFCLISGMTSVIALQVRGDKIKSRSTKEEYYPRITKYALDINIFLMLFVGVDYIFNLKSIGALTIQSLQTQDYGVITACIFIFILIVVGVNFLIDVAYGIYFALRSPPTSEVSEKVNTEVPQEEINPEIDQSHSGEEKHHINSAFSLSSIKNKVNFPLVIVCGGLLIVIGIFTLLLPVILDKQALLSSVFSTYYGAPSPEHIWGTTNFGRDVFGRTLWELRSGLGGSLASVALGAIFGIPLGFLAGYYRKWVDPVIMGIMGIIFFTPIFVYMLNAIATIGAINNNTIMIIGRLLIPVWAWFTREALISNKRKTIQWEDFIIKILADFCLILWITICVMFLSNFMAFGNPSIANWGHDALEGVGHLSDAPWAALYPAFFPSILGLILILLYFGLTSMSKKKV